MKIRKAKKSDFKQYLRLKKEEEKDYSKITKQKIKYPKDNILKKEFNEQLSSRRHLILVIETNKELIGYIYGTFFNTSYSKGGYIEDIFVLKNFRKKGLAIKLINEFIKILKNKGYKKIHLSVNVKNKGAIELYKKLGFELYHYDFKKEWK